MNGNIWLKWSWRDLKARWLQVLAVAIIIALGTGVFAGLGGQETWRKASYDLSYERLNMYDLRVQFTNGSYVDGEELVAQIEGIAGVATVENRILTPTLVDTSNGEQQILVRGELVGVDVADGGPHINGLGVDSESGRALNEDDAGQNVAVLEYKFARHYGIEPGDPLRISGDIDLELVGTGHSPEYFMVMPETGAYHAEANFAVVFVPLDTAQRLLDREGLVNETLVLLEEGANPETVGAEIEQAINTTFPDAGFDMTKTEDDPVYTTLYSDAEGDQALWNSIAMLFLIGAAMGAFNLANRMVESQRRQIGIYMALGVPPRKIAIRPLLAALEIAVLGTIFGLVIGLGLGQLFASILTEIAPLPYYEIAFYAPGYIQGIVLGIIIPFAATLFPVWRAVRVAPVDAIQTGHLVAKGGGLSWLMQYIPLPGKSFVQMPLKNLLRAPWRMLLTVLGIAIAVAMLVLIMGAMDIFIGTMEQADTASRYVAEDRVLANLNFFYPAEDGVVESVSNLTGEDGSPLIQQIEPAMRLGGTLIGNGMEIDSVLELHDMANAIWRPALLEGQLSAEPGEIILSQKAAEDLNLGLGSTVTLRHPRREGLLAFQMVESTVTVTGIHDNPLRPFAYMDSSSASLMNLDGLTNQLVLMPAEGVSEDTIRRALMTQPGITSAEPASELSEMIDELLGLIVAMLGVIGGIVLLMSFLIAFNSTTINVDERVREIATMFAFGLPVRTAARMQMLENVVIGVLGTALGMAAGWLSVYWLFGQDMPELEEFHFIMSMSPMTFVAAIVVGVVVVGLTPILSIRKLRRMDIPSTLRVME